jgi:hypothetical protein
MLESTFDLLAGLFLGALILLIGFCVVGSIVVALRALSQESDQRIPSTGMKITSPRRPDWAGVKAEKRLPKLPARDTAKLHW